MRDWIKSLVRIFCFDLPIFGMLSLLRFDFSNLWNKADFASFFQICGINRLRFPSICLKSATFFSNPPLFPQIGGFFWKFAGSGPKVATGGWGVCHSQNFLLLWAMLNLLKGAQAWEFFALVFCTKRTHLGMWLRDWGKKSNFLSTDPWLWWFLVWDLKS